MNGKLGVTAALGIGAGLMYWFDPTTGRRRRLRAAERATRLGHAGAREVDMTARDIGHRLYGRAVETKARLRREEVSDGVLAQRVRSRLGRIVSHPGAINVAACEGCVTLSGPILTHEVARLIGAVRGVRGVQEVMSDLQVHDAPSSIPALQEGRPRVRDLDISCTTWPNATRGAVGAIGAGIVGLGALSQHRFLRALGLLAGGGMIARAATNEPLLHRLGVRRGKRAVIVDKTITINQPVAQVFSCFSDFSGFPHFMTHVRSVTPSGEGRFRWVVDGPAGVPVSWEAQVTRLVPDQLVAWRSVPESLVKNAGRVVFTPVGEDATRIEIHMSYNPVIGVFGHLVAKFFGVDPKHQLEDDLVRMKSYLETGKTPRDAADKTSHGFGRNAHLVH